MISKQELEILKSNDIHSEFHEFLHYVGNKLYHPDFYECSYEQLFEGICNDFNKCQMMWIDNFVNRNWV